MTLPKQRRLMRNLVLLSILCLLCAAPVGAQVPAPYGGVLDLLGKGDYRDGVLKVNLPRADLHVRIAGYEVPTAFGFSGWVAMTRGSGGHDVMMGDLVLLEDEVNPVMSALLAHGFEVTALHNHFFFENPRVFYMHVHGHGEPVDLARRLQPALALTGKHSPPAESGGRTLPAGPLDGTRLAAIIGHPGEQNKTVYKIVIGRPDLRVMDMGATVNSRMGLNTWAAFVGSDSDAMVCGDVAMLDTEVDGVLRALRGHGLDVVAIHHHMTGTTPQIIFLHYWGRGPADALAKGVRAALDGLGPKKQG